MNAVVAAFAGTTAGSYYAQMPQQNRHCERSEAIQKCIRGDTLDCFAPLAMTSVGDGEPNHSQRYFVSSAYAPVQPSGGGLSWKSLMRAS